jgi:hypothetical protein
MMDEMAGHVVCLGGEEQSLQSFVRKTGNNVTTGKT